MSNAVFEAQLSLWSEQDGTHEWAVRESHRARRLTVRVLFTGRVEVVVPPRTSAQRVARFVEQHRPWIERKRREVLRRSHPPEPFPPERIELAALGEAWRVHLGGGPGRVRVHVASPGVLSVTGDAAAQATLREALRRWLIARSREALGAALAACAAELGFTYRRLIVRRQRTRWGSCSTRGTISLNCCLLFQPPEVVRYLLVHELAHTRHMDHSARFWQCVERHCPEAQRLDPELLDGWRRVPSWVFAERERL